MLSPLRSCGFTKAMIRNVAEENKLPVADKPSYACLATRIPSCTPITAELLEKTEAAEAKLLEMGFRNFRVRYACGDAKIELGKNDFPLFYKVRDTVYSVLSEYYNNVLLDLKERTDE